MVIAVIDALCVALSMFAALWIRFEFNFAKIEPQYVETLSRIMLPWVCVSVAVFAVVGLYKSVWRYVGIREIGLGIIAHGVLLVIAGLAIHFFSIRMPRSFYCFGFVLSFISTCGIRLGYRFVSMFFWELAHGRERASTGNVMVIGAGAAGSTLIREFATSQQLHSRVACVIDDNPMKHGQMLEGVHIVGDRYDIPAAVRKYNIKHIIYAIPNSTPEQKKEILSICSTTKCEIKTVPGLYQLINGEVSIGQLKNVEVEDLLGREPVNVNLEEIYRYINGKVVMVTGGGGSIGSELCRQIAKSGPALLIIFDIYENNAYDIQMELKRSYPNLNLLVLIGSVRDPVRLDSIFDEYRPQIVFHAAAHKHVPLMEDSPNEAIKNNVFGTYKTAMAAAKYGVKKFVLISTDKAVNPTNIMGASKRLCEMVVQMMSRKCSTTDFVAVRFGNVLGSNGSVIPLFRKQIAEGGPVTVTHPEITRFFMTIPEAASLVLQAGYYAAGGEIFVLDMGQPVKIDTMARNLIRLSGYEPDVDIKVVYTGLRPGEKLYEELLMNEEGLKETANKLIHIGEPIEMDDELFSQQLERLEKACSDETDEMKDIVADIVPTYKRKTESQQMREGRSC